MLVAELEVGKLSAVDHVHVRMKQLQKQSSVERTPLDSFGPHLLQNFAAENHRLLSKLLPKRRVRQKEQILQMLLAFNRPDQSEAVAIFEKMFEESSYFIFTLNGIGTALLRLQSLFQVIPRLDRHSVFIN